MRCGKIAVEGEPEEFSPKINKKVCIGNGKKKNNNPYSTRGLDKFETVYADLSRKRSLIARKTGAPENVVRFIATNRGWTAVLARPSLPKDRQKKRLKDSASDAQGQRMTGGIAVPGISSDPGVMMAPLTRAIASSSSTSDETLARSQAMAVSYLRGGILSMRSFIGFTFRLVDLVFKTPLARLLSFLKPTYTTAIQPMKRRRLSRIASEPSHKLLPALKAAKEEQDHHRLMVDDGKAKNNKVYRRIKSLDVEMERLRARPRRSYAASSESFLSLYGSAIAPCNATLGWIVIMLLLFGLVFFGRSFAVVITTMCWYLVPAVKNEIRKHNSTHPASPRVSRLRPASPGVSRLRPASPGVSRLRPASAGS